MSPTVEELTDTLKKLITQIDSLEIKFKNLVDDTYELNQTITLTKEYNEELDVLNNLSDSQPRTSLICALQDETKQVRDLENENSELHSTIKNYQQVLDIIMNKYRTHSDELSNLNQKESNYKITKDDADSYKHKYLQEKINHMAVVMDKACQLDETKVDKQKEMIIKLKEESNNVKNYLLMSKLKKLQSSSTKFT